MLKALINRRECLFSIENIEIRTSINFQLTISIFRVIKQEKINCNLYLIKAFKFTIKKHA
jgi:hypothetical protein